MKPVKLSSIPLLFPLLVTCSILTSFSGNTGYRIGDKAMDFKLKNVDGKMVSPGEFKEAKGFIIIFTCNHCPFSVAYEDRIIDLHKKYERHGYPVLAINPNDDQIAPDDSFENMIVRAGEKKFPFFYLHDKTQDIARTYGALKTPHVFIVAKKGNDMIVEYIGAIDDNTDDASLVKNKYVENAMSDLMAGNPVKVSVTKAIGCSVKYRK